LPRHDSLNLRKEVILPINYEDTLSSCRDKLGSMRLVSYMTLWHVELRIGHGSHEKVLPMKYVV
jgi:hypothetical protein